MIDRATIVVASGRGGDGAISGRREKYVPKGGPDGGAGGDGGSVLIRADRNVSTLRGFHNRKRFEAAAGSPGAGSLKHGGKGASVVITVPVGTQIIANDGSLVADLDSDGEELVAAAGGQGGRGNASFANSVNQFPLLAEAGEAGVTEELRLELKLLADVGLVGLPNAGKSSLLRAISNARPKVADYPFTTLEPALGLVEHRGSDLVVADIPGLIEGASAGVGLGLDFLRHIERARVIIHVVDAAAPDPSNDARQVESELELYGRGLSEKPRVVALNKMDIEEASNGRDQLVREFRERGSRTVAISAAARWNLTELLDAVTVMLAEPQKAERSRRSLAERLSGVATPAEPRRSDEVPVLRPKPIDRPSAVIVCDGVYVVENARAARIAQMVDMDSVPARLQFYALLRRMGIVSKLEELGVKTGDTVRVGESEWEWA